MQQRIFGYGAHTLRDFINRFVPRYTRTQKGWYKWGTDDNFPQDAIALIANNGAALRAMRLRSKYITANGFDAATANITANPKENVNQLLAKVSHDVAIFQAFALQVLRDASAQVKEVHHIPIELLRKNKDGSYTYNTTIGTDNYKESAGKKMPAYKGLQVEKDVFANQIKTFGNTAEVAFFYVPDPISFIYPFPDWYSGEYDLRTGSELMMLDNEMVTNGFMPSAILTTIGEVDDEQEDDQGYTQMDHLVNDLKKFTGNIKDAAGKSGRNKLLLLNAPTKEAVPVLQTIDIEKIINGSIEKRDDINRTVSRLFGVHPVLLGYSEATVLGNQQALANASMELANNVIGDQEMICEAFKDLFGVEFQLTRFTPISYIPEKLYDVLTSEEKRALIGYSPLNTAANVDQQA